jgi:hypothetical protein
MWNVSPVQLLLQPTAVRALCVVSSQCFDGIEADFAP